MMDIVLFDAYDLDNWEGEFLVDGAPLLSVEFDIGGQFVGGFQGRVPDSVVKQIQLHGVEHCRRTDPNCRGITLIIHGSSKYYAFPD